MRHFRRMDEQNRTSLAIAKRAGNSYDSFVGFTGDCEEIGLRPNQTQQSWRTARNRLSAGQAT